MTVQELGERMTARELAEWRAFYDLEPFGDLRNDFRTGILASIISNMFREKRDKPLTPVDFMIHQDAKPNRSSDPGTRRESQEKMIEALKTIKPTGGR